MREMKERNQADLILIPPKKRPTRRSSPLTIRQLLLSGFGFLAARAVPIPGIAPFGIAYLSMERSLSPRSILTFLMVLLGYLSLGDWFSLRYIGTAVAILGSLFFLDKPRKLSGKTMAMLSAGMLLIFNAFSLLWSDFSIHGFFTLLLDPAMAVLGVLIFERCHPFFSGVSLGDGSPSEEERLSLWLLFAVSLLSLRNFWGTDWLSIANVAGFTTLGFLAVSGGIRAATLGGPILGFLLGFGGDLLPNLAIFSFCGLVCGIPGQFRKFTTSGILALTGLFLATYAHGSHAPVLRYFEAVFGAGILLLLPNSCFRKGEAFVSSHPLSTASTDSYRGQVQNRLAMTVASFRTLADTFVRISEKEAEPDNREVAALFDLAASQVCRTCSRATECWKRNFNATYQTLLQLLQRLERKGAVRKLDVDPFFSERCLKLDAFLTEINRLYEIHKINQVWKQKLCENRLLVGEQFNGVAEILERLGTELSRDFDSNLLVDQELRRELEKQGLHPEQITLSREMDGRQTIRFTFSNHRRGDTAIILSVLHQVLGKTFAQADEVSPDSLLFREFPTLTIEAASASSQKEEESGDAHGMNQLQCGKYIATLSDGMGTGHRAGQESTATISLLNAFLDAGFDKTVAVKLINSVMVMKSAKEAFTTVDLCMVDLYTGEAEFIKNGAEPSYIKRKTGTETVRSASLPVGVLSGVEVESFAHRLTAGDTVVMVSDGLALKASGGDWLRHMIDSASWNVSPQDLADEILARALALKGGEADDDMTVLVLRLDNVA